jgi:hypothetical protein
MTAKKTAVFIDGTALYLHLRGKGPRPSRRHIDYGNLDDLILDKFGVDDFDTGIFFTTFENSNANQISFIKYIEEEVGWTVEKCHFREAIQGNIRNQDSARTRFDTQIAFALGRVAGKFDNVCVVTDSYPIAPALLETGKRGTKCILGFYGEGIDPRWHSLLRTNPKNVEFLDFDAYESALTGHADHIVTPEFENKLGYLP